MTSKTESTDNTELLVGTKVFMSGGEPLLRAIVKRLSLDLEIRAVSSIFRVNRERRQIRGHRDLRAHLIFDGLAFVLRLSSSYDPETTFRRIEAAEVDLRQSLLHKEVSLNILVWGGVLMMTPRLTIPHPEFHEHPEEVVPAAEVWPDYFHPVLERTLSDLAGDFVDEEWGVFFAQGKNYIEGRHR